MHRSQLPVEVEVDFEGRIEDELVGTLVPEHVVEVEVEHEEDRGKDSKARIEVD